MKKSAFVITEIFLTLVLTVSAATAVIFAADVMTDGAVLPDELIGVTIHQNQAAKNNGKKQQTAQQSSASTPVMAESSQVQQSSQVSETVSEVSKAQESSAQPVQESSKTEESKTDEPDKISLILDEPKDLKKQPAELEKFIKNYGYSFDMLGFDHMVVVNTGENSTAKIYCYEKSSKGFWWNVVGDGKSLTEKAFIGEKGADFDIKPDSNKSPLGFYSLGDGFYIGEKPDTTYPMFEITENTYWVDDTKSKFYNQHVEGTDNKDWSSADHMIASEKSYKYGIVVDFNTSNPDKKLASSIFIHCGDAPTTGSIVVPEESMKTILEWLESDSNAYIFVTN